LVTQILLYLAISCFLTKQQIRVFQLIINELRFIRCVSLVTVSAVITHRARHSFRTIAAKKGIRDSIAERIMGHAEGNDIKDIYTHLQDEDIVQEMLDKWVV